MVDAGAAETGEWRTGDDGAGAASTGVTTEDGVNGAADDDDGGETGVEDEVTGVEVAGVELDAGA